MDKIRILIDHNLDDDDIQFSNNLKDRLKGIKEDIYLTTYSEVSKKIKQGQWDKSAVEAIKDATIVIPIITTSYITDLTPPIELALDDIINSTNRFLFPILFKSAEWSSLNWLVKSKLTPSDEIPLSEYSTNDADRIINDFVRTIKNVIAKQYELTNKNDVVEENKITGNEQLLISHDHDDADFAELLKLKLEKHNLKAWVDSERLKIGQDWREEIDNGIENSLAVIAIMTPDARKSEYVTYEWSFAWGKGKKIFPIMLKQTQLHPRLESLQYLDFTNRTTRPWEKLINSIKELLV